jgi:hypothetical protein
MPKRAPRKQSQDVKSISHWAAIYSKISDSGFFIEQKPLGLQQGLLELTALSSCWLQPNNKKGEQYETTVLNPECLREFGISEGFSVFSKRISFNGNN